MKKRGRPKIGKIRTYRISERDYEAFKKSCEKRGLEHSKVLRLLIINFPKLEESLLFTLLEKIGVNDK